MDPNQSELGNSQNLRGGKMRKSRNALIGVLALGTALIAAPGAMADGSSDNISTVEAGVAPNYQSSTKPGPATLFSQVQTKDGDGDSTADGDEDRGPLTIVSKAAERVQVHFDNDIHILDGKAANKFDTCGGQGGNDLDNTSTEQAAAECKDAIIGSGQAEAIVPTQLAPPAPPTAQLELTITTINGPTTVPGGPCTAPADGVGGPEGCEYQGGNPQIILHAYEPVNNVTSTVGGEVRASDEVTATGEPYGSMLVVNDAPDTASDFGSLILFNSTVGKQITQLKVKNDGTKKEVTKLKKYDYVTATCEEDAAVVGPPPVAATKEYDFRGEWVYDDGTTDVDTYKQKCGNETSTPAP
jgi:hypothetical protein